MSNEQVLWMTEPDDVHQALKYIREYKRTAPEAVSVDLMVKLSRFVRATIQSGQQKVMWTNVWREMGQMALTLLEQTPGWSLDDFIQLLLDKHRRYGLNALLSWAHLGMAIRVDSKCDRLDYMVNNRADEGGDESTIDTIQDILGYSILGMYMCEYLRQLAIEAKKPKLVHAKELPTNVQKVIERSGQPNGRLRFTGGDE